MNSMAIIYQLVSRCYQDPHFGKETLLKAATCTLKSLKQYLKEVALCGPVSGFVIQVKSSLCVRFNQIEESDIFQHENIC